MNFSKIIASLVGICTDIKAEYQICEFEHESVDLFILQCSAAAGDRGFSTPHCRKAESKHNDRSPTRLGTVGGIRPGAGLISVLFPAKR